MSAVPDTQAKPTVSRGRSIGAILIDSGRLTAEDAEKILRLQKERGMRFGDAAQQLRLLTEDDIRFALARQFDYPYLPAGDHSLSQELVAAYRPFTEPVERLRALRSQLVLRWFDGADSRKALAIVSPGIGDGRSFLAANLAIVFSQLGERTVLVDADLRNPRQHELFHLANKGGLSDVLAGRAGPESVVRIPNLLGLSVLPAGATPPNPQELLGRVAFVELLQELGKNFDTIIIDTPATGAFADAHTVAARAGAALLVARKNLTSASELQMLARSMQQSGVELVGSALNVS
ncbi:MAG: chain length determinant protein tyrosine kinase EpsG [Burkholderiales bacterium]|nr:chain length determinant protein tyrosine kinase EpsG [Burkholderiales bacterium]